MRDQDYNLLFVSCAVAGYAQYFSENGATKLNCMIQERSDLNSSDAFGLIADAIHHRLINVQKSQSRRLAVTENVFKIWRDRHTDLIPNIQATVVSAKWPLKSYPRTLSEQEREILNKNIGKGRLYEVVRRLDV